MSRLFTGAAGFIGTPVVEALAFLATPEGRRSIDVDHFERMPGWRPISTFESLPVSSAEGVWSGQAILLDLN